MRTLTEVSAPKRYFQIHIMDVIDLLTPELVKRLPKTKDFNINVVGDNNDTIINLDIMFGVRDNEDPKTKGDLRGFNTEGTFDLRITKGE